MRRSCAIAITLMLSLQTDSSSAADRLSAYFAGIHRQLDRHWSREVLARAQAWLPPNHPANRADLMTEVTVEFDVAGRPRTPRVSLSSGHQPFDVSALHALASVKDLPPPPSEVRGIRIITWRFHRDARACSPRYARLEVRPFTPLEELQVALLRRDIAYAEAVLLLTDDARLPELLADMGLRAQRPELRCAALRLATSERIEKHLLRGESDGEVWAAGVDLLASRREQAALGRLLAALSSNARAQQRQIQLLHALSRYGLRPRDTQLAKILGDANADVVLAAAPLTSSRALIDEALARWRHRPEVAGPLWVQRYRVSKAVALEQVRRALSGSGLAATIEALRAGGPAPELEAELSAIAQDVRAARPVRIAAIELLAKQGLVVPLYRALRDRDTAIQIVAARVLGEVRGNRLALSYRLAEVAFRTSGELAAEALASLARIGDERFRWDTLRQLRRLDPDQQARAVTWLWRYGKSAVPTLVRLLAHPNKALREAARRSAARLPTMVDRRLIADVQARRDPFEALLLWAVEIRQSSVQDLFSRSVGTL